jgi:hypothetical protein
MQTWGRAHIDAARGGRVTQLLRVRVVAHAAEEGGGARHLQQPLRGADGVLRRAARHVLHALLGLQLLSAAQGGWHQAAAMTAEPWSSLEWVSIVQAYLEQ